MTAHERFAEWDAAYLIGALSPADRAEYETHLSECERCRGALADLAPTLGLLSRVPEDHARALLSDPRPEEPAAEHRARVLSFASGAQRRRRRARALAIAAASVLVVAAVGAGVAAQLTAPPSQVVALRQVVDIPLSASVRLSDVAWGTRVDLTCEYGHADDAPAEGWAYALVVVADDGEESVLSTWRARPGTSATVSAGTELAAADIATIEIRAVASGDVLMRSPVDGDRR